MAGSEADEKTRRDALHAKRLECDPEGEDKGEEEEEENDKDEEEGGAGPGTPNSSPPRTPHSTASSGSSDTALAALRSTVASLVHSGVTDRQQGIDRLKKLRAEAVAARKKAQRAIRNGDRKRSRIFEKAKNLSTTDIMELIAHRAETASRRLNAARSSTAAPTPESSTAAENTVAAPA